MSTPPEKEDGITGCGAAEPGDIPVPGHKAPLGLRTVAVFEFAKGLVVLLAGLGLLTLIHHDVQKKAEDIVTALNLNPARRYPHIFIEAASKVHDPELWSLCFGALIYSIVRFVEAYGLWHERAWAEYFAIIGTSIYLFPELGKYAKDGDNLYLIIFLINLAIVAYLAYVVISQNRKRKARGMPCDT